MQRPSPGRTDGATRPARPAHSPTTRQRPHMMPTWCTRTCGPAWAEEETKPRSAAAFSATSGWTVNSSAWRAPMPCSCIVFLRIVATGDRRGDRFANSLSSSRRKTGCTLKRRCCWRRCITCRSGWRGATQYGRGALTTEKKYDADGIIAIGGNSLIRAGEQGGASQTEGHLRRTAAAIVDLLRDGLRVVLTTVTARRSRCVTAALGIAAGRGGTRKPWTSATPPRRVRSATRLRRRWRTKWYAPD